MAEGAVEGTSEDSGRGWSRTGVTEVSMAMLASLETGSKGGVLGADCCCFSTDSMDPAKLSPMELEVVLV